MVRVLRYRCHPDKRSQVVELLPDSTAGWDVDGREAVIWALDPDDDDYLVVVEYWTSLEEFAAGTHSENLTLFGDETEGLIAGLEIGLEAIPVQAFGLPQPARASD